MSVADGRRTPTSVVSLQDLSSHQPDVRRRTRIFVWSFLAMFCICGLFGFELWPMTGWRLFADQRTRHHVDWSSEVEYVDGSTGPLVLRSAGSGTPFMIGRLDKLTSRDRDHLCQEWLALAGADADGAGNGVRRILIFRMSRDLGTRIGDKSAPPAQELAHVCEGGRLRLLGFPQETSLRFLGRARLLTNPLT